MMVELDSSADGLCRRLDGTKNSNDRRGRWRDWAEITDEELEGRLFTYY